MEKFVIIVAGGNGSRMRSDTPKQFLPIGGLPVLMHTLQQFYSYSTDLHLHLVLPALQIPFWQELCHQYAFRLPIQITAGGATRFQSVRNGLLQIHANDGLIAVHDGVRPFISTEIIHTGFVIASQTGSAVTAVPLSDSMRVIHPDGGNTAVDRTHYRLIQTPQTFRLDRFRQAFLVDEQPFFTDCASVVDYAGYPITLIDGSYENIKITTPEDLAWARYRLES